MTCAELHARELLNPSSSDLLLLHLHAL